MEEFNYIDLYPKARKIKRKVYLYIGPTNAGKTYNSLNKLMEFKSGTYLAPLRLLALEGKEEIEKRGQKCSFITGEEKEIINDAMYIAQTIETFNFNKIIDAVLIDEIQLIDDANRGWAWTQALIGAPARNVILTGSLDIKEKIIKICNLLNDELEIIELNRHTELLFEKELEKNIMQIRENSAIIAFSRKEVLNLKKDFDTYNIPVSIIYGNLSPEIRREEARKFREKETKYLIATDAIAMGLNLPIETIIFNSTQKFNGKEIEELSSNDIRQIAGRAGRYNLFNKGYVTSFSEENNNYIQSMYKIKNISNDYVFIKPNYEIIKKISKEINTTSLTKIFNFFHKTITKLDNLFKCSDMTNDILMAIELDKTNIDLEQKYFLSKIPLDIQNEDFLKIYKEWINNIDKNEKIELKLFFEFDINNHQMDSNNLLKAENNLKILSAFLWIAQHNQDYDYEIKKAKLLKTHINIFFEKNFKK